ncbi:antitoxin Xre/MbcA/ParS toxin-binding domain-containing protein [Cupriavidus sp. AU9028]|uniref:antitoxin Xre/MbcA/ParS toxin-binding domain-containing protein n=1 Tax=Cupriavidus sp. AU9028 TaxID=2871157 RepID=UPI001C970EFB|nr:antitoxin Xre/MbcA/ParS toxin-binding domain-containing protein [Cupriavidus sp. AU9028]MBY4899045.1 DUF2384 domain-containing protein [Cupriavidus sp. AU9028]
MSRSDTVPRLNKIDDVYRLLGDPEVRYVAFFLADREERIGLVKHGLPASILVALSRDMAVSRDSLYGWLGIARATANRKVKADDLLSKDESESALGLARLVGLVEQVVAESGDPTGFDAATWTASWLQTPHPALGGRKPADYMDTADGRELVASLVRQMQSGAYA